MENVPLTVCVPTYNPSLAQLEALIRSVTDEQVADVDVVICDDGSSNAHEIRDLVNRFPTQVSAEFFEVRLGMVGNWNRAIGLASSQFVILPGQDDVYLPRGIDRLLEALGSQPVDLVFGGESYIDEAGEAIQTLSRAPRPMWESDEHCALFDAQAVATLALCYGNVLGDPCVVAFARSAWQKAGGFDSRFGHAADLEMWVRLAQQAGLIVGFGEPVAARRLHSKNLTITHVKTGVAALDRQLLFDYYGAVLSKRVRQRAAARLVSHDFLDRLRGRKGSAPRLGRAHLSALVREGGEILHLVKPPSMESYSKAVGSRRSR